MSKSGILRLVMKRFTSPAQKTGLQGEDVAALYLEKKGYRIIERNFGCKIGELDLVVEKGDSWYGVEVKSVATRGGHEPYPVWQNLTAVKRVKLRKTLQVYAHKARLDISRAGILGVMVYLRMDTRRARVEIFELLH